MRVSGYFRCSPAAFQLLRRLSLKKTDFYESFFSEDWNFFYKLVLAILVSERENLMTAEDPGECYLILKLGKNSSVDHSDKVYSEKWAKLLVDAHSIELKE